MTKVERQMELEREMVTLGRDRFHKKLLEVKQGKASLSDLSIGMQLMARHLPKMTDAIQDFVENPPTEQARRNNYLFLYLTGCTGKQFRPDEIAFIVITVCQDAFMFTQKINDAVLRIADLLEDNNNFRKFEEGEETAKLFKHVQSQIKTCSNYRRKRILMKRSMEYANVSQDEWNQKQKMVLGNALLRIYAETTGMIDVETMIQYDKIKWEKKGNKRVQVPVSITKVLPSKKAEEWLEKITPIHEELTPFYLPMIITPNKWESPTKGGYYLKIRKDTNLIKTSNDNYIEDLANVSLDKICEAVNALQETPWQINEKVLEIVKYLYQKGAGSEWGLPNPDGDDLPNCTVCDRPFDPSEGDHPCFKENQEAHKEWKRKAAKAYDRNHRTRGKTKTVGKQLFVAEKFRHEDEVYFVHTLDWRGRAYPVGSFLHPQADDVAKGLLQFAEGKAIDSPEALREWKRHGANCFGKDKESIDDRVKWVDENWEAIRACAASPLDNRLWTEAEEPYQFLAFCFDLYDYSLHGALHLSQLPVSMDGACNGLQNFSAMLRDEVGGAATNIISNGERKDIYEAVADEVKKQIAKDAWEGEGYDKPVWEGCDVTVEKAAQAWDGQIDRTICKRGVMTMPYGSKRFGMRTQIEAELEKEAIEKKREPRLGEIEDTVPYSHYLSGILYDSIRKVVIAAGEAMDYLQGVAEVVAKHNLPLKWVTPTGFIVVQDYKNHDSKIVSIVFGGVRWRPRVYWKKDSINPRKQSQGISPNFVHSLDASHMMMTTLACQAEGIEAFAMIHDSFATHAADAPTMQRVLREAFVEMYSVDMLADFRDQIVAQLPEKLAAEVAAVEMPKKRNLILEDVLNSPYFFA